MSREGKLAKSTVIYFIGSFGSKILSFILLPVYANYLTTESYGQYDLVNTVIQIIYPLVTLMLDNALYVYLVGTDDQKKKEDIISFAVKILVCNGCAVVVICFLINQFFTIQHAGWIALWLLSFSVYNTWIQLCRGFNQQKLYSLTGVIVTAVILSGNILGLVVLGQDYHFLMVSNCAAYIISVIFLESRLHAIKYAKRGHPAKKLKQELLRYAVPLLPNQLSWWILNVSDRLMIVYYLGTGANGIYAMACKIPAVLNVVHSVFSAAWSDDILSSTDIKETERYAEKIYNMYIRVILGIAVVLITSNRFIFQYIIAGNFVEAYRYTYFLYVGFIFSSLGGLLGAFYGYYKKSLNVSLSTIAAAIVNFVVNLVFLNKFGIQAASISTCLGSVVIWIIRLSGLKGLVNIRVSMVNRLMFLLLVPFYFVGSVTGIVQNLVLAGAGLLVAVWINVPVIREFGGKFITKLRIKKEI